MMIPLQLTGFLPVMPFKSDVLHGSHHGSRPQVEILVDSITSYLYCVMSIKISTSGDFYIAQKCTSFFCASEVQECVRAIPIMANRFEHDIFSRHHNAHEIAEKSVDLPIRLTLAVHVDIST
jgi:hypothetical protein